MAGVSGGNLWSGESRAWNSMFLQTSTETQTVSPEMVNFSWGLDVTPNSAGSAENAASTVTNLSSSDLFANLGGDELADSPSLLDSAAFVDAQAWNQTLMRSRGSESVQNIQTSSDNLSEAFFTRQKDLVTLPTEWEMKNFAGEDPAFSTITNENGFSHFNNSAGLSDLGSPTLQAPDHTLTSSLPAVGSFNNLFPMSHLQIGTIKQECSMVDHTPIPPSQGLESHSYVKQHISDILETPTNRSFLKAMQSHCYYNGQTFMQGEDQYPGRWSCSTSNSSTFPVSLSQILPTSSQPVSLLNTNRNSPLWDLICSKHDLKPHHTAHNFPQFLHEGKAKLKNIAQHLTMSHADEARDSSNESGKRCSNESSTSDTIFKRPRLDTTNCAMPTFKVRKEKLGDRITALQQLVSPFGKTDTASVLLEAIGYIKFLHDQVQVLSTPYMNNGAANSSQGVSHPQDETTWVGKSSDGKESDGAKQDLRSRGLCLVPVSATLTVTNDNGADYWSNYR